MMVRAEEDEEDMDGDEMDNQASDDMMDDRQGMGQG
jgi:hypothetical protein